MSRILEGRSENAIKNRFNSLNAKGLTETRANELMSKLAPEEAATFLVKGAPISQELDFSRGLRGQGEEDDDGSGRDGDDDDDEDDDDDDGDHDRGGGDRFLPSSGGGFSSSAGGGGARGGGGSGSLEALMVAARDERVACINNYGGERDEEDDAWDRGGGGGRGRGAGGDCDRGGRGGGRRGWSPARGEDGREWGKATRRDGGGMDGRSGVDGEKRGVKRERGACEKMDIYRRKARELVRRGSVRKGEAKTHAHCGGIRRGGVSGDLVQACVVRVCIIDSDRRVRHFFNLHLASSLSVDTPFIGVACDNANKRAPTVSRTSHVCIAST